MGLVLKGGPTAHRIKLTDSNGNLVDGVCAIDVKVRPNEMVVAVVEIELDYVDLDIDHVELLLHRTSPRAVPRGEEVAPPREE